MGKFGNKKVKAVTGVVLASALVASGVAVLNFNTASKASKIEDVDAVYESMLPAMENIAQGYAEGFAESINSGEDLVVTDTVPIYDMDDNIVGYSVAFDKNSEEYGYVNVDFTSDGLVTDFSVATESDSMYDVLTEKFAVANEKVEASDCEDKLISVDGLNYAVTAKDQGEDIFYYNGTTYDNEDFEKVLDHYEENYLMYYDNTEYEDDFVDISAEDNLKKGIMSKFKNWVVKINPNWYNKLWKNDEFVAPTKYPDHSSVFAKEAAYELDKEVMLPQYSKEKSLISQENIMKTTNRYACELVGITAICQQEDMSLNGSLKDTFNKLWDLAGCESRIYETDTFYDTYVVDCSSTYTSKMGKVVAEYAKSFNKKVETDYKMGAKFKFFKDSIDAGNSTSFGYQIAGEGGHGVNVVGYAEGTLGEIDIDYLITGDSWYDDAPRYVYFSKGMFQSTEGNSFEITDMDSNY